MLLAGGDLRVPARLLLVVGGGADVREAEVGVDRRAHPRCLDAGVRGFFGEDGVEAPVVDAESAVLLVDCHRDEAVLAGLREELAGDEVLLAPLLVVRDYFLLEEAGESSRGNPRVRLRRGAANRLQLTTAMGNLPFGVVTIASWERYALPSAYWFR